MGHTSLLIRTRVRAATNRIAALGPSSWRLVLGLITWVGGLIVLGHFAAPELLSPPEDLVAVIAANPDVPFPAGAAALEACFWLTATAASITSFRVMELLFRRQDIRSVEYYPFSLNSLYVDRLLATSFEALLASLLVVPFFLPLVWHGGATPALVCAALLILGLVSSNVVGLSVQLWAGSTLLERRQPDSERSGKSVYGGPGQVFMYSPGVALALSVVLILLAKLALGEVLDAGLESRALWLGVGILAAAILVAAALGWRNFHNGFHRMAARFREADFVGYEISADYQRSAFEVSRLGEGLLGSRARAVFRALSLQYRRRYMLTRYAYGIFWLAGGLAVFQAGSAAFPAWIQRITALVAVGVFFNPWIRVLSHQIQPPFDDYLPISAGERRGSEALLALFEALLVCAPVAVAVGVASALDGPDWMAGVVDGAAALLAVIAMSGAVGVAGLFEPPRGSKLGRIGVCAVTIIGLALASHAGAMWLLSTSAVLSAANVVVFLKAKPSL